MKGSLLCLLSFLFVHSDYAPREKIRLLRIDLLDDLLLADLGRGVASTSLAPKQVKICLRDFAARPSPHFAGTSPPHPRSFFSSQGQPRQA